MAFEQLHRTSGAAPHRHQYYQQLHQQVRGGARDNTFGVTLSRSKSDSSDRVMSARRYNQLAPIDRNAMPLQQHFDSAHLSITQSPITDLEVVRRVRNHVSSRRGDESSSARRRTTVVNSLKNKDWHKDLLEQYHAPPLTADKKKQQPRPVQHSSQQQSTVNNIAQQHVKQSVQKTLSASAIPAAPVVLSSNYLSQTRRGSYESHDPHQFVGGARTVNSISRPTSDRDGKKRQPTNTNRTNAPVKSQSNRTTPTNSSGQLSKQVVTTGGYRGNKVSSYATPSVTEGVVTPKNNTVADVDYPVARHFNSTTATSSVTVPEPDTLGSYPTSANNSLPSSSDYQDGSDPDANGFNEELDLNTGINWSVSKLRNMFVSEKTRPGADKQYV